MPRALVFAAALTLAPNNAIAAPGSGESSQPADNPLHAAPAPPKGRGMFAAGVFGVTFGVVNVVVGAALIPLNLGDGGILGAIPLSVGALCVGLGAPGIHYGKRRRERYSDWQAANGQIPDWIERRDYPDAPPIGLGMLISGSVGLAVGATMLPSGIGGIRSSFYRTQGIAYFSVSVAALATGLPISVIGAIRLHRRRQWHANLRPVALTPTPWLTPTGAGFGLVGQF